MCQCTTRLPCTVRTRTGATVGGSVSAFRPRGACPQGAPSEFYRDNRAQDDEPELVGSSARDMHGQSCSCRSNARNPRNFTRSNNRRRFKRNRKFVDSPLEGDGFELLVREHRAMAPSHGFAAASQREAAPAGRPPPMARPRSEAQRGSVRARRRDAVPPIAKCGAPPPCRPPANGPRGAPPCGPPVAKSGRAKT